jgi:imidazole glycerol-phosphate synthase subunit HisH
MRDVAIIDYGVGNLLSVERAFEHCGANAVISSDPDFIRRASHVVLPGVGAIINAMDALSKDGVDQVVKEIAAAGTPLLGICLGMQMLLEESSEFGVTPTLGLIPGRVMPVPDISPDGKRVKIPNIGWYSLRSGGSRTAWDATVLRDVSPDEAVYFVHSFMAKPVNPEHHLADCIYGGNSVTAVITQDNVTGCQFHPEKSGKTGLKILRNFMEQ